MIRRLCERTFYQPAQTLCERSTRRRRPLFLRLLWTIEPPGLHPLQISAADTHRQTLQALVRLPEVKILAPDDRVPV